MRQYESSGQTTPVTITMPQSSQLDRVRNAAKERRLVVLAGAGVSMAEPVCLPSWGGLVDHMAKHAATFSETRAAAIVEQKQTDLLAAIDLYEVGNLIPPVERARFMRKQFQSVGDRTTEVARELAKLEAALFLTTNYDNVLKNALRERNVEVLSNGDDDLKAALSLVGTQPLLVHLHGRALVPDTLVLGSRSYEKLTSRSSYRQLLRDVFLRYSVLAVGFSFTDPPFQQLLRYVADDLGGAGAAPHLAILGTSSGADAALLRRANFEIVSYDDSNGHAEVRSLLSRLQSSPNGSQVPPSRTPLPVALTPNVTLELSRIYASLTAKHRGQAYDLAAASLVVHGISDRPQQPEALAAKLSRGMALPKEVATGLVHRGTLVLRQAGALDETASTLKLKDWKPGTGTATSTPLVEALNARLLALDKRTGASAPARKFALDVVKRVMLVQGMTAARAFVEADPPDAYLLDSVVREAIQLASVPTTHQRLIKDAVTQILRAPTKDVSRELFELAHAAFALETVFLNPVQVDLGSVLAWQLYLDSNIVIRLLHLSCDATQTFEPLLVRLRRLRIPLIVLRPFLDEILGHADAVQRQVTGLSVAAIVELLRSIPEQEQSPLLRWFSFTNASGKGQTFQQFRYKAGLVNLQTLVPVVERLGIEVDRSDAIRNFDTSDRETLWHDLREFRATDQSTQGSRRLRRAEATQVMWLSHLRETGTRAWFLSQDGQLRRALKYIQHGRFAGYVATPAAWMMKLSEMHWGDVDVAGFSELMWVIPLSKPTERLRIRVAEEVLRKVPDLGGEHPEWLRDRIEAVLGKIEPLVRADLSTEGEDSEEEALSRWAEQVVPPAVEKILDELAVAGAKVGTRKAPTSSRRPTNRK